MNKDELNVAYRRGTFSISVETIHGYGKNPGLYVQNGNHVEKLASFASREKAERFIRYLDYLVRINENNKPE